MLQPFKITDKKTGKTLTVYGPTAPTEQDQEELFDAYEKGTWKPSPPPKPFTITDEKTKLSLTVYGDEAPTKEQEQELFSAYRKGTWRPAARPVYRTDEELTAAVKNREEQGEAPEDVKTFVEQALKDRQNERTRELKSMFAAQTSSPFGAMGLANMDPALRREMLEAQAKPTPAAISEIPVSGQVGDIGMKVAVPLAVGIATRNPLAMAAAGGGIDMLVQQREEMRGEPVKSAPVRGTRVLTESVLTAINPPALKAGTGVVQGALTRGAQTGAMVGAGELAQQVVGQATGQDVVDIGEVFDVATLGAMFGGAFGALETAGPTVWAKIKDLKPLQALRVLLREPKTPEIEKAIQGLQQVVEQHMAPRPVNQVGAIEKSVGVLPPLPAPEGPIQRARTEQAAEAFKDITPYSPAEEAAKVLADEAAQVQRRATAFAAEELKSVKDFEGVVGEVLAPRPVSRTAAIERSVGAPVPAPEPVPQGYSPAAPGVEGQVAPSGRTELAQEARRLQATEAFEKLPPQNRAEEAARVLEEAAIQLERQAWWAGGEGRQRATQIASEIEEGLVLNRLGSEETSPTPDMDRVRKADRQLAELGRRPGKAAKETARLEAQRAEAMKGVPAEPEAAAPAAKPMPGLSPQAQAILDAYEGVDVRLGDAPRPKARPGKVTKPTPADQPVGEQPVPPQQPESPLDIQKTTAELNAMADRVEGWMKSPGDLSAEELIRRGLELAEMLKRSQRVLEDLPRSGTGFPTERSGRAAIGVLANLVTGGGGFVVGWNTGEGLPPEERLKRALAFGAGGAFSPTAIRRIIGMQGWANRVIKERGVGSGALNTADPQILAALSVKGAALVGEGVKNFAEWGDKMVREFGDSIRPKLKEIWAAGQEADIIPNKLVDKAPERPLRQYETPEFKKWFGKSKVVNEDGTPKVMYHGANDIRGANALIGKKDFTVFKPNRQGLIFVTPDAFFAGAMIGSKNERSRIYPLYVKAENIFDFANPEHIRKIFGDSDRIETTVRSVSGEQLKGTIRRANVEEGDWMDIEFLSNVIRKAGFDGLYVLESGYKNLAVFDPNQLKSATGNRGTFSLRDRDIRGISTPAAMMPVAGAGAGAVAGASQGETPEEKLRYAALGAAAGAGAGAVLVRGARGMVAKGISAEPRTGAIKLASQPEGKQQAADLIGEFAQQNKLTHAGGGVWLGDKARLELKPGFGREWSLSFIGTAPGDRGKGYASNLLSRITAFADKNNLPITLTVNPVADEGVKGLNAKQLTSWYKRYGFELKEGSTNRMVRTPAPAAAEPRTGAVTVSKKADIPTNDELEAAAFTQRDAPEGQMEKSVRILQSVGGPAKYNDALEHIGDLSHRFQETGYKGSTGLAGKLPKWDRELPYFEEQIKAGLDNNATYKVVTKYNLAVEGEPLWKAYDRARTQYPDEIRANLAAAETEMARQGKLYADAHRKYNKPVTYAAKLGRDAAIALGEMDFDKLRKLVTEMKDIWEKHSGTPEFYSRTKPAAAPAAAEAPKMDPRIAGYITKQLAIPLGSFAGGFTYGFIEGAELPPDQRLINGLQWAAVAGGIGYAVAKRSLNSINGERVSEAAAKKLAPDAPTGQQILEEVDKIFTPRPTELSEGQKLLNTPQAKLIRNFQDGLNPLSIASKEIVGKGENMPLGDAASIVSGAVGKAEADLYPVQQAQKELVPGLEPKEFNRYFFLRRVIDRLAVDPKSRAVGTWTIEKSRLGLEEMRRTLGDETFINLEKFARVVQTSADEDLRLMVRSGRMSERDYAAIKADNEFYAPFYVAEYFGQMDGTVGGMGRAIDTTQPLTKAVKGMKDDDIELIDIMSAFSINKMRAHVLADKNAYMRRVAAAAKLDTEHRFMKDLGTSVEAKYSGEVPKGWEVVNYMEDGLQKKIAVLPELAKALKGLDTARADIVIRGLGRASAPFRLGVITFNAGFQLVNIGRDASRLGLISKYGITKNPVEFGQFVGDLFVGLTSSWKSNILGDKNELYLEYLKSGAARSTLASNLTPNALNRAIEARDEKLVAKILKVPYRTVMSGGEKFGNMLEETIKLAGFRRGVRMEGLDKLSGKEYEDALERIVYEVRNYAGSPDFNKHGSYGPLINAISVFYNARVQGVSADLRRLTGGTGKAERNAALVRLLAGGGTAAAYVWYLNQLPENKEDYEKRSMQERNAYFLFPRKTETGDPLYYVNEEGQKVREYYRVPKFEFFGIASNMVESALNYALKKDPKSGQDAARAALEGMFPVNISGRSWEERVQSAASGLNPVIKTPIEIFTNTNLFQHRPIVKQRLQGVRPEEQYLETTPKAFITAAQAMPEVAPNFLRSPLYLKQLTENLTGGLVTQFMRPELEGRGSATTNPLIARFFAAPILDEQETWDQINYLKTEQSTKNLLRQRAIDQYIKDSASYTPAQRMQSLAQLLASDPERNAAAMYNALLDRNRGVTDVDRAVRSLEPQFRAQFLEEKVRKMETKEQRDAFYREMILKGIINDKTLEEILKLRTAPEGKKTSMKEGKLYRDPTTGVMKIYRNGAFV